MTFDEVFAAHKGYWDSTYAMIHQGQQVRCIAIGTPNKYLLTELGKSLVADTSAPVVESVEPRKRGPKAKPKQEDILDELDGLDI